MLRSSLSLSAINVIASASSYILTIFLMRVFNLDDFGYYNYVLVFSSFYSILIVFATDQTTARNFFRRNRSANVLSEVVFFRGLMLLAGVVILSFFYDFKFIVGFLAFCLPSLNISYGYEVESRNFKYAIIFLCERLIYSLAVILIFNFIEPNLLVLFYVLMVVSLLSFAYQLYDLNLSFKFRFESLVSSLIVFRENSSVMFATLALFSYGGFSRLILEYNSGYSTLALYSAAWQFVMLGTLFQTQVERVFRPKILNSEDAFNDYRILIKAYFYNAFVPMLFFSIFVFLFGADLFLLIVGDKYAGSQYLIKIFSVYFLVISIDSLVRMIYLKLNFDHTYRNIQVAFALILLFVLLIIGDTQAEFFAFLVCVVHALATAISLMFIIFFNRKIVNET